MTVVKSLQVLHGKGLAAMEYIYIGGRLLIYQSWAAVT